MRLAAREETIEDSPLEDTPVQKRKVKKIKKIKKTSRKNIKLSDFENASQTTKQVQETETTSVFDMILEMDSLFDLSTFNCKQIIDDLETPLDVDATEQTHTTSNDLFEELIQTPNDIAL